LFSHDDDDDYEHTKDVYRKHNMFRWEGKARPRDVEEAERKVHNIILTRDPPNGRDMIESCEVSSNTMKSRILFYWNFVRSPAWCTNLATKLDADGK
jgi:hypothetical protein